MKFDGIIFDLDGTLWDSTRSVAESWNLTMKTEFGLEGGFHAADVAGIMGCTGAQIEERLFSRFGKRAHEMCAACMDREPAFVAEHGGELYPGVEAMLQSLSESRPLFIVSNCQTGYVEAFLQYSGFGRFFRDFEYLGRRGLCKRDNIRLVMERHGLGRCLYVGDTAHDRESALEAGCGFIHAAYGFGRVEAAEAVIKCPAELPELLEKLEK